jgi:hypothetical protein
MGEVASASGSWAGSRDSCRCLHHVSRRTRACCCVGHPSVLDARPFLSAAGRGCWCAGSVLGVPHGGATAGGNTVTIGGSGFTGVKTVVFGTISGTHIKVISSGKLTVTVPAYGAGTVNVRVRTKAGTSPVSARDRYAYDPRPSVSSVSPAAGPVQFGTVATVRGSDFTSGTSVLFGSMRGTSVKVVSVSKLTVIAPAESASTVNVRVATPGGTSAVSADDRYSYDAVPVVTLVSPSAGTTAGGTTMTVSGSGFTGVKSVLFGSAAGSSVKMTSSSQLTVTSPAHAAAQVEIQVVTPGGTSAPVAADRYGYVSPLGLVTNLSASKVTSSSVTLSWSNPSSPGFSGVMIRRAQGATPPASTSAGTLVTKTGPTATSYTDSGLTAATEYSYAVFADDGAEYSAPATITVTTGQPAVADVSGALTQNTTWSPQARPPTCSTATSTCQPGSPLPSSQGQSSSQVPATRSLSRGRWMWRARRPARWCSRR